MMLLLVSANLEQFIYTGAKEVAKERNAASNCWDHQPNDSMEDRH